MEHLLRITRDFGGRRFGRRERCCCLGQELFPCSLRSSHAKGTGIPQSDGGTRPWSTPLGGGGGEAGGRGDVGWAPSDRLDSEGDDLESFARRNGVHRSHVRWVHVACDARLATCGLVRSLSTHATRPGGGVEAPDIGLRLLRCAHRAGPAHRGARGRSRAVPTTWTSLTTERTGRSPNTPARPRSRTYVAGILRPTLVVIGSGIP